MQAAQHGVESAVKLLLSHPELQVNLVGGNSEMTPLASVANKGYENIVEQLLARPEILVNTVNNAGKSAIMYAASRGHEGVVALLLEHPVKSGLPHTRSGCSMGPSMGNMINRYAIRRLLKSTDAYINLAV